MTSLLCEASAEDGPAKWGRIVSAAAKATMSCDLCNAVIMLGEAASAVTMWRGGNPARTWEANYVGTLLGSVVPIGGNGRKERHDYERN